jgi:hypothetical protein
MKSRAQTVCYDYLDFALMAVSTAPFLLMFSYLLEFTLALVLHSEASNMLPTPILSEHRHTSLPMSGAAMTRAGRDCITCVVERAIDLSLLPSFYLLLACLPYGLCIQSGKVEKGVVKQGISPESNKSSPGTRGPVELAAYRRKLEQAHPEARHYLDLMDLSDSPERYIEARKYAMEQANNELFSVDDLFDWNSLLPLFGDVWA